MRRVLFEPQPAQPRRYVHAVILGSEERQPLMDQDIPLPLDLPAAALKIGAVSNVVGSASNWELFKYRHHWPGKSGTAGINSGEPTGLEAVNDGNGA